MERRKFLLSSLLAAPLTALARFNFLPKMKIVDRPEKGFIVRASESRFFGKPTSPQNTYGRCILSSVDTDNQLYINSGSDLSYKEKGGPPLHIHYQDNEIFYVISGEFLFQLGEEVFLAKAGDTAFCPKGLPHTYANPIENNPGNMLTIHQPISPDLEKFYDVFCHDGYFSEEQMTKHFTPEELKTLTANNPFVGPPIDINAALKTLKG